MVPAAIVAYVVATWAVFFGISYGLPETAQVVRYAPDFAGHLVFGPLIVFIWFSVATMAATYAGLFTAPNYTKVAASILGIVILLFTGLGAYGIIQASQDIPITLQMYIRTGTEGVGMLFGFAAGIYLAYENGEFDDAT